MSSQLALIFLCNFTLRGSQKTTCPDVFVCLCLLRRPFHSPLFLPFFRNIDQHVLRHRHRTVRRSGLLHPAVEELGHGSQLVRCSVLPAVCVRAQNTNIDVCKRTWKTGNQQVTCWDHLKPSNQISDVPTGVKATRTRGFASNVSGRC